MATTGAKQVHIYKQRKQMQCTQHIQYMYAHNTWNVCKLTQRNTAYTTYTVYRGTARVSIYSEEELRQVQMFLVIIEMAHEPV